MPGNYAADLRHANERRVLAVFLWACIAPPAMLFVADAWLGTGSDTAYARVVPVLAGLVALVVLARTPRTRPVREWSHWAVIGVSTALLLSYIMRPESEIVPLRARLIGPALIYLLAPNTLLKQAGPAIALSASYVALRALRMEPFVGLSFASDAMFLAVLNVAGVLRTRSRLWMEQAFDKAWEAESTARLAAEQARAEVRTLESIIPICMHCRKLRSGAGEWQQLERYVRDRTGSQFSHGLCPACLEEHYPEPGPA